MKPFGCDLDVEVDRNTDILKQMLRKYENPGFDITKRLCIKFVDELEIDAGGVSREYFHLLMEIFKYHVSFKAETTQKKKKENEHI